MTASSVQCGNCGAQLVEDCNEQDRQPCPNCGSKRRAFNRTVVEVIHFKEMLKMKVKTPSFPGRGRIRIEQQVGDDLHRRSGRWFKKERVIDRENDRYFEKITDPESGVVIHYCDEPLAEHFGHGSAKR